MQQFSPALVLAASVCIVGSAQAGTIVQEGFVSGTSEPTIQDVVLNQFDDQGGALVLTSVKFDFLTSIIGGYTTDGSGIPVHIVAQLDAEWSFGGELVGDTQALIDTVVANTNPGSFTVFNTDTDAATITDPADLAPWIGPGTVVLQVFTEFQQFEDPEDIIFFGAGGTVRYTVTYNFVPAPGAAALLGMAMCGARRRRRAS